MQAVLEAHDTPFRLTFVPPAGFGVRWIDHRLPFQRSTSAPPLYAPTAVQAVVDTHDTSFSKLLYVGFGVSWIDHRLPFQCSASIVPPGEFPTAVHAVGDGHDTPASPMNVSPVGLGVSWIDQLAPSQRSTMASVTAP